MRDHLQIASIGILGAGQLALLLGQIVKQKQLKLILYAQSESEPALTIADEVYLGERGNEKNLKQFFNSSDIVLLESEFYAPDLLDKLSKITETDVYPSLESYGKLFSKKLQKEFFNSLNIPNVSFQKAETIQGVKDIKFDGPYMVKLSSGGYDGYGNFLLKNKEQILEKFHTSLEKKEVSLVVEQFIEIKNEYACLLIKNKKQKVVYPVVKTVQEDSICVYVDYPSGLDSKREKEIQGYLNKMSDHLPGTGIYAFEFFEDKNGKILVNEAAPRVHNSFHFSIEAFDKGQFEMFIDACLGIELTIPKERYSNVSMLNLLGRSVSTWPQVRFPNITENTKFNIYMYGKKEGKVGRKLGHITFYGSPNTLEVAKNINKVYEL